jgi:hypothetical protein
MSNRDIPRSGSLVSAGPRKLDVVVLLTSYAGVPLLSPFLRFNFNFSARVGVPRISRDGVMIDWLVFPLGSDEGNQMIRYVTGRRSPESAPGYHGNGAREAGIHPFRPSTEECAFQRNKI